MTIFSNNRALAYFHPGAVSSVPRLVALLLTANRLSSLEDVQVKMKKKSRHTLQPLQCKLHPYLIKI